MILFMTLNSFLFFFLLLLYLRELKKRKTEEASFLSLFEEGILILKKNGKIARSNRAFYKILGVDPSERNFLFISKAINQELLEKSQALIQRVTKKSEQLRETFFHTTKEGSAMVNLIAYAIDPQTRVLIFKDINQDQREFSLGKEFIANASHELRTPITIIKGFVETLKDLPEISDVMLEDIFEKILRNCKRMDDIVKNLLILTDLDHLYKPNKEPFELYSLLDNSRHMIQEIYPNAEIEILGEDKEINLYADISLVELAISNLLQNAVKYSNQTPQIKIAVEQTQAEIKLCVIDRGIGIPKESLPHIFNRFYSVNKTASRRLGGAGLGLSIVKKIVEKHQGSIIVEDNPLGGTIFSLHFPKSF